MTAAGWNSMEAKVKERLYRLIDRIPDEDVRGVERYLEFLTEHGDPLVRALMNAPEEDEELSEAGEKLLEEGLQDLRAGQTQTLDEVERELGL
jgi:CO dehydrogenase/acetyl-CoA synthase beta subunit